MTDSNHRLKSKRHMSLDVTGYLLALTALLFFSTMSRAQHLQLPKNLQILPLQTPAQMSELKIGHGFSPGSVQFENLKALQRRIEEKRIGKVMLYGRKPYDAPLVQSVKSGELDMAVVPFQKVVSIAPRFGLFNIPFLFRDENHVADIFHYSDLSSRMLKDLHDAGLVGVGWWPGEFLLLAGRKVALEPDDLRGLKVAVATSRTGVSKTSSASEKLFDQLGATVLRLRGPELRSAWRAGEVDVIEGTLQQIRRFAIQRISVTYTNHLYAGFVVVANPTTWMHLPETKRSALLQELQRQYHWFSERLRAPQVTASKELKQEYQTSMFRLTRADRLAWYARSSNPQLVAQIGPNIVKKAFSYYMAMTTSSRGPVPVISWNAWLEDNHEQDVTAPLIRKVYTVNLDIARYAYKFRHSAYLHPGAMAALAREKELTLLLIPVLTGNAFVPAPGSSLKPQKLKIHLNRTTAQDNDARLLESFDKGKLTTRKLSEKLNLGSIASWKVKAQTAGCGGFSVSVWDEARVAPLDNVEFTFGVGDQDHPAPECGKGVDSKAMSAGLKTLLTGPFDSSGEETKAHAALHLFEVMDADKTRSVVVLVDRARLKFALNQPDANAEAVFAWTTASQISKFATSNSGLPELIRYAHKSIGQLTGDQYPFEEVALELALKLFGGETPRDRQIAKRARERLKQIVEDVESPSVLVRVITAQGRALYLPFGLLAAKAQKPIVKQRFTVFQPLIRQTPSSIGCIRNWHMARPPILQDVAGDAGDLLEEAAERPPAADMTVLPTHDELARYFNDKGDTQGEGLILLAHHNEGNLWFSRKDEHPGRITREHIVRSFAPGSAALLAACATTGTSPETTAIVDQFISLGIEAMVISPFAVDADFGTRLALEFEQVVAEARQNHKDSTLRELFETSAGRIAAKLQNQTALQDMALEFQLVGNPDLRLCK